MRVLGIVGRGSAFGRLEMVERTAAMEFAGEGALPVALDAAQTHKGSLAIHLARSDWLMKNPNEANVFMCAVTEAFISRICAKHSRLEQESEGTRRLLRSNFKRQTETNAGGKANGGPHDSAGKFAGQPERAEPYRPAEDRDGDADTSARAGEITEDDLIRKSLVGDDDAFEVLVRRYSPRVFNIIGSFFRRRDMIEDIAQEVFSRSYFSLSSFTLGRSFEAWVAKIAVNACYDHLRAQRRRSEHQIEPGASQEDDWLEFQMLEAARDRHNSAERQREAADIAERLLKKLEPEDRLVLVLMDRDGFSVKEISEMTGWGQSKIKVRAFRARRTLRAAMKRLLMGAERKQRSGK